MYISTEFRVGETVYFTDDGNSVTRADIKEIRVTQYYHSQHVAYRLAYGGNDYEVLRDESKLHRRADSAFSAWDRDHPQAQPEVAEA
jgi:hypothetical protein